MKRGNTRRVNIKKLKQTEWINEEIKLLWKILIINARLNKITITNYGVIKLSV
jgi:hypothetical protein